jgi:hypothetical protein
MECQQQHIAEKLVPYIEGALADADRQEVQLHLQECQVCSQEVRSLNEVVSSLRARVGRTLHFLPTVSLSPDDVLDYALESGRLSETTRRRIQLQLVESLDLQQEVEWLRELESELDSPEVIPVPAFPAALNRALDEAYGSKTRQTTFKRRFFQPRILAAGLTGLLLSGLAAHSLLRNPVATTAAVNSPASTRGDLALNSPQTPKKGNQPMLAIAPPEKSVADVKLKNNQAVSKQSNTESLEKSKGDDKQADGGSRYQIPRRADSPPPIPSGSVSYYVTGSARANPPAQQATTKFQQSTEKSDAQTKEREPHQDRQPLRPNDQIALNDENIRAKTGGEVGRTSVNNDISEPNKQPPNPEPKATEAAVENRRGPVSNVESARPEKLPELPTQVASRNQEPIRPTFDDLERRPAPVRQEFKHEEAESGSKTAPGSSGSEAGSQPPQAASSSEGILGGSSRSSAPNAGMSSVDSARNRSVRHSDTRDLGLLQQAQKIAADMQLQAEFKFERRQDDSLLISVKPQRALDPETSEELRQALRTKLKLAESDSVVIGRP